MLWGLLAAATPVLIHFINRMRHRPVFWGAMLFLARARRSSTRFARLRRFLLLACRVLSLAALALLLARPLLGGFVGRMFAGPPDLVVIVLDRSASMDARTGSGDETLRERALRQVARSRSLLDEVRRVVVLDSATGKPVELPSARQLADERFWRGTDTRADVPLLVERAMDLVAEAAAGRAEIWVVSDAQAANWRPSETTWKLLSERWREARQDVVLRLLSLSDDTGPNASVRVVGADMRFDGAGQMLDLSFEILASGGSGQELVVSLQLNGRAQNLKVVLGEGRLLVRRSLPLPDREAGWGMVEIPADGNARDNRAFFAWEPPGQRLAVVVAEDTEVGHTLGLAACPFADDPERRVEERARGQLGDLAPVALLIWQGSLPSEAEQDAVQELLEEGGQVLFFPGRAAAGTMAGGPWLGSVRPVLSGPSGDGRQLGTGERTARRYHLRHSAFGGPPECLPGQRHSRHPGRTLRAAGRRHAVPGLFAGWPRAGLVLLDPAAARMVHAGTRHRAAAARAAPADGRRPSSGAHSGA